MEIDVINNQVEQAMLKLKRQLIKEGIFKELKKRRYYAKPSVHNKLKREEAEKNRHKDRKRTAARERNLI